MKRNVNGFFALYAVVSLIPLPAYAGVSVIDDGRVVATQEGAPASYIFTLGTTSGVPNVALDDSINGTTTDTKSVRAAQSRWVPGPTTTTSFTLNFVSPGQWCTTCPTESGTKQICAPLSETWRTVMSSITGVIDGASGSTSTTAVNETPSPITNSSPGRGDLFVIYNINARQDAQINIPGAAACLPGNYQVGNRLDYRVTPVGSGTTIFTKEIAFPMKFTRPRVVTVHPERLSCTASTPVPTVCGETQISVDGKPLDTKLYTVSVTADKTDPPLYVDDGIRAPQKLGLAPVPDVARSGGTVLFKVLPPFPREGGDVTWAVTLTVAAK